MIYLDTSVLLADVLGETARPHPALFDQRLMSSRLLQYETRARLNALGSSDATVAAADERLARVWLTELSPIALTRALEPFPVPVRTLDALHLATLIYLRSRGHDLFLSTYDARMKEAAEALHLPVSNPADPP